MDPYEVLKVKSNISDDDLRRRKKELLVSCHPDKVQDPELKKVCEEHFKMVTKAYEDIMILRRFQHPNRNVQRSDYCDRLFSMYPRHEGCDESLLDDTDSMCTETSRECEELEAHMRAMKHT